MIPVRALRWAVALGLTAALVPMAAAEVGAATSTVPGIDVSHHNGTPDWDKVKQDGIRFVIAKATEGSTFTDPAYAANKAAVEARGMAFTAYHFARPDKSAGDAATEADFFVAAADLSATNLVPVLDLEDSGGLSSTRLTTWVKSWLAEVETELGVKATIYTTASFWKAHLGNTHWFARHGYRLWVAHWTTAAQPSVPASNWAGRGWTLWQYSDSGTADGISGPVDLDRFNGARLASLKIKNNR